MMYVNGGLFACLMKFFWELLRVVVVTVADNFLWREDSSGSEADAPHYPLDLRLAEAR